MYKLLKTGMQKNIQLREYIVDAVNDIASLPDSDPFGSTAFVIATSEKYMKNSSGEYIKIIDWNDGGSSALNKPLEVIATPDIDADTGKETLILNKTAAELYSAACDGKMIKASSVIDYGGTIINVINIVPFSATKLENGTEIIYEFSFVIVDDSGTKAYYCEDVSGDDVVVLVQV